MKQIVLFSIMIISLINNSYSQNCISSFLKEAYRRFEAKNFTGAKERLLYMKKECIDVDFLKTNQMQLDSISFLSKILFQPVSDINKKRTAKIAYQALYTKFDSKRNKYGYVNKNGDTVIDFIYDQASDFTEEGFAEIKKGDNLSLLKSNGKEIISTKLFFIKYDGEHDSDDILDAFGKSVFSTGLKKQHIKVEGFILNSTITLLFNKALISIGELRGVYDCEQKRFVIPLDDQEIEGMGMKESIKGILSGYSSQDVTTADFLLNIKKPRLNNENEFEYSIVNFDNKKIVAERKYSFISHYSIDGLIEVKLGETYGLINNDGLEIIKPVFEDLKTAQGGLIPAKDFKTHLYGFIDYKGQKLIKPTFHDIASDYLSSNYFENGLCAVSNYNGTWGYVNKSGDSVIDFKYYNATPFVGGYAAVEKESYVWKVIDKNGKIISFDQNFGSAEIKTGLINDKGNLVRFVYSNDSLEVKNEKGEIEYWISEATPYFLNFLGYKKCRYLELMALNIPKQEITYLLINEKGDSEIRRAPMAYIMNRKIE